MPEDEQTDIRRGPPFRGVRNYLYILLGLAKTSSIRKMNTLLNSCLEALEKLNRQAGEIAPTTVERMCTVVVQWAI
jgi:hypothetical protein